MEAPRRPISPLNIYTAAAANRRRVAVLFAAFFLLIFIVAYLFGLLITWPFPYTRYWALVVAGVALFQGILLALWLLRKLDIWLLEYLGVRRVNRDNHLELFRIVENLAIGAGLPAPQMYVVNSPWPNAFATGHNPRHASLVVTSGLLQQMDRNELEGVIAHEMSHIANRDTLVTTLTSVLLGLFGWIFIVAFIVQPKPSEGLADVAAEAAGGAAKFVGGVFETIPSFDLDSGDSNGISITLVIFLALVVLPLIIIAVAVTIILIRAVIRLFQWLILLAYLRAIGKERPLGPEDVDERIDMARKELKGRISRVHAVAVRHGRLSEEYQRALAKELWHAAPTGIAFYPGIAKRLHFGMSREREYLADASGALLTRNPTGLADALEKMGRAPEDARVADPVISHLLMVSPKSARFETHPPIEDRVARLRAMAGEARA